MIVQRFVKPLIHIKSLVRLVLFLVSALTGTLAFALTASSEDFNARQVFLEHSSALVPTSQAQFNKLVCVDRCDIVGTAYRLDTQEAIYREEHRLFYADETSLREIFYRDHSGKLFAYKLVDSLVEKYAPNFWFLDFRLDQLQSVIKPPSTDSRFESLYAYADRIDAGNEYFLESYADTLAAQQEVPGDLARQQALGFLMEDSDKRLQSPWRLNAVGTNDEPLIADAGFDAFIVSNWSQLDTRGYDFRFIVPSRNSSVAMKINKIDKRRCEREVFEQVNIEHLDQAILTTNHCFKIRARNWIIDKILGAIYIVYDDRQRLRVFKGLSNVRDNGNKRLYVYISYLYANK